VLRYRITASGCELARRLVQVDDAMTTTGEADCLLAAKPLQGRNKTTSTDCEKQHASEWTDSHQLCVTAAAAATAGVVGMDNAVMDTGSAVNLDVDKDWQMELGVALSQSDQQW